MLLSAVLFVATGLLMVGLAVPLVRRRVRPNRLYGLRVPATFADEWVWYEANARSGRDLFVLGGAEIAAALLLPWVPGVGEEAYVLGITALLGLGAFACAVVGWRRANRLLAERRRSPLRP